VSTCRTCRAPIVWVVTAASGTSMPVDPDPVPDGNLELIDAGPGQQPRAVVVDPGQLSLDGAPRYVSHFVTCPQADQHRKART
jgi:hypothetical protein